MYEIIWSRIRLSLCPTYGQKCPVSKQSFLVIIHYLIFFSVQYWQKKKEFYLKLLDYLIGTQHILEATFSIKTSGGHIFIDFKRVMSTSLLHFLKNKLFIVSIHFVNPRNHIFRWQKLASRRSSERVYIVHYWFSL